MSRALAERIPAGAEVTVTLKNGKTFTGFEDSTPQDSEESILTLYHPTTNDPEGDRKIFWAPYSELACVELVNIR